MKTAIKFSIPVLGAQLAILASCSDDPATNAADAGRHILFDAPAITLTQSRGMENSLSGNFMVYGYCAPQNISNVTQISWDNASAEWESKSSYIIPRIFSQQTVAPDGSYSVAGGGPRLWEYQEGYPERDFKYTFLAHYPADRAFDMNKKMYTSNTEAAIRAAMGVPELTYTMPFSGGTTTTVRDIEAVPDAMWAAVCDIQKSGTPVRFRFNHLLSAFRFMVNNYTNLRLEIKSLRISGNFYRSTTLNFKGNTPSQTVADSDKYAGQFNLLTESQFIPAQGSAGDFIGASDENNNEGTTLMLLGGLNPDRDPDYDYLGSDIRLTIDYTLYRPLTDDIVNEYTNVTTTFKPGQLRPGVRYTVNLNCLGNEFVLVFLPETDNWEGDNDNDIIIN